MNRFTEQLLSDEFFYNESFHIVNALGHVFQMGSRGSNPYSSAPFEAMQNASLTVNWIEYKLTFVCLLAAMSDEDIDAFVASFAEQQGEQA